MYLYTSSSGGIKNCRSSAWTFRIGTALTIRRWWSVGWNGSSGNTSAALFSVFTFENLDATRCSISSRGNLEYTASFIRLAL